MNHFHPIHAHENPIWLVVEPYPSEKYEFVSWDYDIPNIWKNKSHVPNHQPDYIVIPIINHY